MSSVPILNNAPSADKISDYVFNPDACVFVSANAGSGKTSLLVNRVLSLLLDGVEPSKILCLTFTNAAAAEMESRILKSLGGWVMANDTELLKQVSELTGGNPSSSLLTRARSLFATVLESATGVNIQTIHGFSQSLLRRFPLEAGVNQHFSVMDGRSEQEVMAEARLRLFNHAQKSSPELVSALDSLAKNVSEAGFNKLIGEIVKNKRKFSATFARYGDVLGIEQKLRGRKPISAEKLFEEYFSYEPEQIAALQKIAAVLLGSEKETDNKTGIQMADWMARPAERAELADGYVAAFVKKDGESRKTIFTKAALTDEGLIEILRAEQERVRKFEDARRSLNIIAHTLDVLHVAEALLAEYERIKLGHAWMDYDDLVMTACRLLTREGISPWVLFKLDGGIDHILVDEAQDTSPEQWQIIEALTQEFFAGQGAREILRSLFIVGDEKQSIYSFQGADVKELARRRAYFADAINAAGREFHSLELTKSYRSTEAVLTTVDAVFARPAAREGVTSGDGELRHILTKVGRAGIVELWPLIQAAEEDIYSPTTKLVQHIAETIRGWIERGEARAGDIMILLRSRTTLADRLVRALKRRGVAVAGSDRMALNDNIAVQDLIALGQVLLLPEDDLTLAACLKSPIFNFSEEELFSLAYGREKKSLWQRLAEMPEFARAYGMLSQLHGMADFTPPFELYSYLLNNMGARANFIGRMGEESSDPIDEFMQQALLYERAHPPSLQGFLHWLSTSESIIKRDMEQARDAVRIMTIHGAKGLQAKIVILPDTVETPKEQDSLMWRDGVPVKSPEAARDDSVCRQLRVGRHLETLSEYRRLLYVALTRAEDRLYVFGATGKDKVSENSWYHNIRTGMTDVGERFETGIGEGLRVGVLSVEKVLDGGIGSRSPRKAGMKFEVLRRVVPVEPTPNKPLVPSRMGEDVSSGASPVGARNVYAVGKFVHRLLQYLPAQENGKRRETAEMIARKFSGEIAREVIDKAIENTLAVMEKEEFGFLFGTGSMAEVPITGTVKGVTVSGQIDRMYMGEKEVWIVDFKSNQIPPEKIPVQYVRQLALYRLLMQQITPGKRVVCALLWTANAKLDVLAEALLDEAVVSTYI